MRTAAHPESVSPLVCPTHLLPIGPKVMKLEPAAEFTHLSHPHFIQISAKKSANITSVFELSGFRKK